jgi:transcriptional regulator GlxA family with amidase domain
MFNSHQNIGAIMARFIHGMFPLPERSLKTVRDDEFLARVHAVVRRHIDDPLFNTSVAAEELAMSRMHLNRRLRALTGKSTHEFVLAIRMDRAKEILLSQTCNSVKMVSSAVGFRSGSHFAKVFRAQVGTAPSRFRGS